MSETKPDLSHFKPRSNSVKLRIRQPDTATPETEHATTGISEPNSRHNHSYELRKMAAATTASAAVNDAENRIVGMMVGSAVADAAGIYTDSLTKGEVSTAYQGRRIWASYKANELTRHYPDDHRAKYEVSRFLAHNGRKTVHVTSGDG